MSTIKKYDVRKIIDEMNTAETKQTFRWLLEEFVYRVDGEIQKDKIRTEEKKELEEALRREIDNIYDLVGYLFVKWDIYCEK